MTKGTGRQGFIFPLPHLQPLTLPRALLQIYRAPALQGLKITVPIAGVSSHPPRSQGLTDITPGHLLPWMEDSHLLLELPARSAKEENLLLAHARHGIVPHGLTKAGGFGSPSGGTNRAGWHSGHGARWLNISSYTRLLSFNLFKRKSLAQRVSPHFPQMKLGLLIHPILLVGRAAPARIPGVVGAESPRAPRCSTPPLLHHSVTAASSRKS